MEVHQVAMPVLVLHDQRVRRHRLPVQLLEHVGELPARRRHGRQALSGNASGRGRGGTAGQLPRSPARRHSPSTALPRSQLARIAPACPAGRTVPAASTTGHPLARTRW
eukprot:scaffold59343_cov46-Phaeocystis_antarctica.AAC.2